MYLLGSTSFVFWLAVRTASAQMHESAFGEVHTFPLPAKYEKCTLVSWNHSGVSTFAAWSGHHNEILLATFDSALSSVTYTLKHTAVEFDDLYAEDFDNDGAQEFMVVNRNDKSVAVVLDLEPDSLQVSKTITLPFEPEHVLIGDYNNDKNIDALVYSRKTPGILPLIGNGKGRFKPGKIIAPDYAIGAAEFAQVNDDNLVDIIVWDWVRNELHVLYGVGKGRFIDQSVFPMEGEVETIVAAPIIRRHALDFVLKLAQPSEFQIWEGNDLGDFQLKNHITFEGHVADFGLADVNNDGLNDIVASTVPASLQVVFNSDGEAFTDHMEYASGDDPQNILIPSKHGGEEQDCIVFDSKGGQFIIYRNAMRTGSMVDSIQITTGISPTEIIANDFNKDGVSDIALINTKSKSVSLYFGNKSAAPSGPFFYMLTGEPSHLAFHSFTDTTLQLILSFPQSQQISYFSLNVSNNSVSNAVIGSEGDAQVLIAALNNRKEAEFATLNSTASEGNSLSFYEQLGPNTFIERNFRLSPPDYLLGASVTDLNGDHYSDIVYAYRAGDTSIVELGAAFGDSSYSMKRRILSRELALPDVKQAFIYLADFDRDTVMDLLLHAGPPVEYLMTAKGKGDGQFSNSKIIASGLPMNERSDVQIIDLDGDGLPDIVFGSQKLGQIIWFRNRSDCNFDTACVLVTEPGMSHYVVADVNADGINDIAMTLNKKGILKIINGKRLPFYTAKDKP